VGGLDDDGEKGVRIAHTLGGPQEMAIVNECGPLSLILTSRIPKVMP
jgi:prophage antirepressor-like protein